MARLSKKTILSTLIGATITSFVATSLADIVLPTNTIKGNVRFSNTEPTIVALLQQQQLGMTAGKVMATSSAPMVYSSNTTVLIGDQINPQISRLFELSAESEAGGPGGIMYSLGATVEVYAHAGWQRYYFQPVSVVLQPKGQQPNGVSQDLADCIGLVHFRWGLDPSGNPDPLCNTLLSPPLHSATIATTYSGSYITDTSEHYVFQLGNQNDSGNIWMTTGTDPTLDTITHKISRTLNPACNMIQDICIDMYDYIGNGAQLGSLTGPFDVVGETEQYATRITASDGPSGNQRYNDFTPPEMPLGSPMTWWTLPNMVPGDYLGQAEAIVRTGRQATRLQTPPMLPGFPAGPMTVQAGVSFDLQKNIDGDPRYPFVMHPARFVGDILLADPAAANGNAYSTLSSLRFSTDPPVNSQYPWMTALLAYNADPSGGSSSTSFDGTFDASVGMLSSVYEQIVVNAYDIPTKWLQNSLQLRFSDPAYEREGVLNVNRDPALHLLAPGDSVTIDHKYCFNEVTLHYSMTNGLLFDPSAHVTGGFNGTDWQGNATDYTVSGYFYGWPKTSANAASNGTVHLALPQGTYTIQPGTSILAPSGSTSSATFATTTVTVECGQAIDCPPGLCVSVSLPLCAPSATPDLTGTIASNGEPVDRIWYTINGGPEIDICAANCGANPSYSVPVNLVACDNSIQVFASANGQTASITTTTTWADPNDNIVCEGSCEPPPPAETCATLQAEPLSCVGGNDGYVLTLDVTNETNQPIAELLLTDPHVSPHIVTLPSLLQPGQSTSVSITVTGVNPGAGLCLNVGLTNESQDACCSKEVCFTIPGCCFSIENEAATCIPGAPNGEFSYTFEFENHTPDTIEHVFIKPSMGSGFTVSTDLVDIPPTIPGNVASVGPLLFSGATPGEEICINVSIHDGAMKQCCADDVCFTVPQTCGIIQPPIGKAIASAKADSCTVSDTSTSSNSSSGLAFGLVVFGGIVRRRAKKPGTWTSA